ncbi:MAG: hypothetical protein QXU48_03915, partial [Thermoplasmata archaeon]
MKENMEGKALKLMKFVETTVPSLLFFPYFHDFGKFIESLNRKKSIPALKSTRGDGMSTQQVHISSELKKYI